MRETRGTQIHEQSLSREKTEDKKTDIPDDIMIDLADEKITGSTKISGVVVGTLVSYNEAEGAFVDFPLNLKDSPLKAKTTYDVSNNDINNEVVIMFENGDPLRPIVIGPIYKPEPDVQKTKINTAENKERMDALIDNEKITINAEKEIVLRCGKSSITLTKAGKIIIRGKYILSRSAGVNRIKGGSVEIN